MATLADRALRSVLSTVDSIRPTTLGLGIVPALGQLARHFEDAHGIPCVLRAQGPGPAMTEERATMTYRMAEALLGTIAERPGTERVELSLATGGTNHLLSVRDRNPAGPAGAVGESIGLVVVQEFAWRLGGEVVVIDEQGGRMVEVTIPAESGAHAAPRPASRLAEAGSK